MVSFNGGEGRLRQRIVELEAQVTVLQAAEERCTIALAQSSVGIFDWDLAHRRIYVSPILQDMLGYAETGLPLQLDDWLKVVAPQDRYRAQDEMRKALAYGADRFEAVYQMLCVGGATRLLLFRAVIMRKSRVDGGEATRVLGTAIDVTGLAKSLQGLNT